MPQQSPYNLDPVQLIAMNGGTDEQTGPVMPTIDQIHRHGKIVVRIQTANRKADDLAFTRSDRMIADLDIAVQPLPRVRVRLGLAFFSMNWITRSATFFPVASSIPRKPGEEFTSITTGP